jgi:hypothetical protein
VVLLLVTNHEVDLELDRFWSLRIILVLSNVLYLQNCAFYFLCQTNKRLSQVKRDFPGTDGNDDIVNRGTREEVQSPPHEDVQVHVLSQ